jgi:hypothetical protein
LPKKGRRVPSDIQDEKKIPSLCQAKGFFVFGGADGARTRDLLTASQTFSQLNYGPTQATATLCLAVKQNRIVHQPMTFPIAIGTFSQLNYGPTKSVTLLLVEAGDALYVRPAFLFLYLPFSS